MTPRESAITDPAKHCFREESPTPACDLCGHPAELHSGCDCDPDCVEAPQWNDATSECATCGRIFAGHGDDCGDAHTVAHREAGEEIR